MLTASLLTPLLLAPPGTSGNEKHEHDHNDEHHQHDAYVHGIAALNVAVEGQEVHIELDSRAANIVAFEHAPLSEADHAALKKPVATLEDGDALFRFNDIAGCRWEAADVASELIDEDHEEHADGNTMGMQSMRMTNTSPMDGMARPMRITRAGASRRSPRQTRTGPT